jgi:hypothetical protein
LPKFLVTQKKYIKGNTHDLWSKSFVSFFSISQFCIKVFSWIYLKDYIISHVNYYIIECVVNTWHVNYFNVKCLLLWSWNPHKTNKPLLNQIII